MLYPSPACLCLNSWPYSRAWQQRWPQHSGRMCSHAMDESHTLQAEGSAEGSPQRLLPKGQPLCVCQKCTGSCPRRCPQEAHSSSHHSCKENMHELAWSTEILAVGWVREALLCPTDKAHARYSICKNIVGVAHEMYGRMADYLLESCAFHLRAGKLRHVYWPAAKQATCLLQQTASWAVDVVGLLQTVALELPHSQDNDRSFRCSLLHKESTPKTRLSYNRCWSRK